MAPADKEKVKEAVKEAVLEALEEYFARPNVAPLIHQTPQMTDAVGKQFTPKTESK